MQSYGTRSLVVQLLKDLEKSLVRVIYWDKPFTSVSQYTDFVSNCLSVDVEFEVTPEHTLEGIVHPRLVIRQDEGSRNPDLDIPLEHIRSIEIWRREGEISYVPHAWWFNPFGGDLERYDAAL